MQSVPFVLDCGSTRVVEVNRATMAVSSLLIRRHRRDPAAQNMIGFREKRMDLSAGTRRHALRLHHFAAFSAAWCGLIVLMLAALGAPASANPFFFSKTHQDCNFCHQPGREMSGVGGLNDTGRSFLQAFKRCPECALRNFAAANQRRQVPQQASGGTFQFRVCNSSSVPKIGIAVRYQTRPGIYRSAGWYHVSAGQCGNFGPFPKGPFWFHAEESGTTHPSVQWGSGSHFCVERNGKFVFEASHKSCDASKSANAFYADVRDDTYTWRAGDGPAAGGGQSGCQNLCVRQYNACRQENGPNCLTLRQGCWNRCRMNGR